MERRKAENIIRGLKESREAGGKKTTLGVLKEIYGAGHRKGLNKFSYQHPLDTVKYCMLDYIDDTVRSVNIFRCALLHDALEDGPYSPDELRDLVDLTDRQYEIIKLLSRNVENENGMEYLDGIIADEDALLIKLADRIANMNDLKLRVKKEKGFYGDSLVMAEKYIRESRYILDEMGTFYPEAFPDEGERDYTLYVQVEELQEMINALQRLMKEYNITEGVESVDEAVYPEETGIAPFKDITIEDIVSTDTVIRGLWKRSNHLQTSFPEFLNRLDNVMREIEGIIEREGYERLKELFNTVRFDVDDYVDLYIEQIDREIYEYILRLKDRKERIPKEGLMKRLCEEMGKPSHEMDRMLRSKDRQVLGDIHDKIVNIMDSYFDDVELFLEQKTRKYKGKLKYRPTKYKALGSSIEKYLKNKDKGEFRDYLDLYDILGFRATFSSLENAVEFAISVVQDTRHTVFTIRKYLGKGSAYQGINLLVNFIGLFNFEVQSVIDKVQVATDINHDIFYKEILQVTDEEESAVVMLVQISLGLLFRISP